MGDLILPFSSRLYDMPFSKLNSKDSELVAGFGDSLNRSGGSTALLQKVLDTIPQCVFWKDKELNYLGCNKLFARAAGLSSPDKIVGLSDFDLPWEKEEAEFYRKCDRRVMESGNAEIGIAESQVNADGELTWLETNKAPLYNDAGEVIGVLGSYNDITRLKQAEETLQRNNEELERRVEERTREIKYVANHDQLTGLLNRGQFVQQLNEVIGVLEGENIALMFIDLDNFKPINDTQGHDAGDHLLVGVGEILKSTLGPNDFAGRFGGDEFLVLMRDVNQRSEVAVVCEEILRRLNAEIEIKGKRIDVAASIGVVYCDSRDYPNSDSLVNDADLAMYAAKRQGKSRYCFFTSALRDAVDVENAIRSHIMSGIHQRQFVLHYQPIINFREGKIRSFEALARWQHPERGLLFPDDFIPVAEATGLIVPLGHQIIETACQQLVEWDRTLGDAARDLKINVNFSPIQILESRFVDSICNVVESFGISPTRICIEITESLLVCNPEKAIQTLRKIKSLGFQLHLDDFGTGYSSLNYLDELPVDVLKIDQSFVQKLENEHNENAVVRMIVAMADALDVEVVAEGVENQIQIETLESMNCVLFQGNYFSKSMPADMVSQYICDFQANQVSNGTYH